MEASDERGETLLEIVIALVVMGLVVGAFFATYATQGSGSTAHRELVTADAVLRGYAESTKSAVREQCEDAAATQFTVSFTSQDPAFTVNPLVNQPCPPRETTSTATSPWPPVAVTVTMPNGNTRSLSLVVRSP
jgi:hypothetical protein